MEQLQQLVEYILPAGTLEWFEVTDSSMDTDELCIVITEKNNPPITPEIKNKLIKSKGFKNITITDFPIRGRKASLTFRRRYWQVEGEKKLLKRDINLCAPGTQLEKEFASFLKDASRDTRDLFDEYC